MSNIEKLFAACQELLDVDDASKAYSYRLRDIARLANTEPEEAKRQLRLHGQPRAFDCGNAIAAIRKNLPGSVRDLRQAQ